MASPDSDRTLAICDLLLGAAHADATFRDEERASVKKLLVELGGGALGADVEARLASFDAAAFDLTAAAAPFQGDSIEEKRKLLHLVAAIHDADEELDLDEDAFLRGLGAALSLPEAELEGLALDVEVEELRDSFSALRKGPPPIPDKSRAKTTVGEVDVDVE